MGALYLIPKKYRDNDVYIFIREGKKKYWYTQNVAAFRYATQNPKSTHTMAQWSIIRNPKSWNIGGDFY
jgi:hypothetical protein